MQSDLTKMMYLREENNKIVNRRNVEGDLMEKLKMLTVSILDKNRAINWNKMLTSEDYTLSLIKKDVEKNSMKLKVSITKEMTV